MISKQLSVVFVALALFGCTGEAPIVAVPQKTHAIPEVNVAALDPLSPKKFPARRRLYARGRNLPRPGASSARR